ncbi:unnamed protein product [Schistosoma intercalatum]|nr:unnamed protein product [Schistosoma intercalatum]
MASHDKLDFILYSYLKLDNHLKRISILSLIQLCFLRELSHKKPPTKKNVNYMSNLPHYGSFLCVHSYLKSKHSDSHLQTSIKNNNDCRNLSICSTDTLSHLSKLDQLLPIIQYVVIRSGIMYLGAELDFIEHLAPKRLSLHGLLPYLMNTLQACYDQILNEGKTDEVPLLSHDPCVVANNCLTSQFEHYKETIVCQDFLEPNNFNEYTNTSNSGGTFSSSLVF